MKTKIDKCSCCPDGGAILEATYDDEPTWICRNCGIETKRQIHTRSEGLTRSQINSITIIQQYKLKEGREVKKFSVRNVGHVVSVVVEVGAIGDEGTMAALLCRDRGHFFVGRRGKIEATKTPNKFYTKSKLASSPLIFGWDH